MEDVEAEAGKKIANFCRNYDTYWLEDTTDERRDIQSSEQAPNCWFGCGICLFNIQCKFLSQLKRHTYLNIRKTQLEFNTVCWKLKTIFTHFEVCHTGLITLKTCFAEWSSFEDQTYDYAKLK